MISTVESSMLSIADATSPIVQQITLGATARALGLPLVTGGGGAFWKAAC